jgi:hypothetical protein
MRVTDERFEPARFRLQYGAAERQQAIVPPSLVLARLTDEAERDEPGNRGVERASAETHVAAGALRDVLNHAVAMAVAVGQREQDMELMGRERQEANRVVSHTSNLDVSGLDVEAIARVGWRSLSR